MVVNEDKHGILSALGFTDSRVCCCDRARLREATDIEEVTRGNVNHSGKRPAAADLFFDFSDNQSTTPYSLSRSVFLTDKYSRKVNDGGWPMEAITLAHGRYPV